MPKIKFKNTGGIFRMKDEKGNWLMIKHNQIFEADPDDIPEAFKDLIIPVTMKKKASKPKETEEVKEETTGEVEKTLKEESTDKRKIGKTNRKK